MGQFVGRSMILLYRTERNTWNEYHRSNTGPSFIARHAAAAAAERQLYKQVQRLALYKRIQNFGYMRGQGCNTMSAPNKQRPCKHSHNPISVAAVALRLGHYGGVLVSCPKDVWHRHVSAHRNVFSSSHLGRDKVIIFAA